MLRIHLFGHLRVFLAGGELLKLAAPPKTIPLFAYLLLNRSTPIPRNKLAFTLWPDTSESRARANLRRHLHRLQHALPATPPDHPWLLSDSDTVQWNPQADFWLDVAEFERLSAGVQTNLADPRELINAIALYTGDLLENVYEDWVTFERERLRSLYVNILGHLISLDRQRRHYDEAIVYAQQLLRRDPLHEDTVRQLMALRYESGDRAGALEEFTRFSRRLRKELSVEPMPETLACYEAIIRNTRLPDALPVRRTPARSSDQIQRPQLPFTGRQVEIDRLLTHWRRAIAGTGGVTLISGEAGIGKTRLVSEFGLIAESQGGRVLCGCTDLGEPQPYQAMVDALRPALPLLVSLEIDPLWLAALTPLLPDLQARLPVLPSLPALDPGQERQRLFESLRHCLEGLAQPRPLLLILEDMHWASDTSIALLEMLALHAPSMPLQILVTYQEEETQRTHPLRSLRRRFQQEGLITHLALGRLSSQAVYQIVAQISGPGAQVEGLAHQLDSESEGNPFFLNEIIQNWLETGEFSLKDGMWDLSHSEDETLPVNGVPLHRIQAMISKRLSRLSHHARALVEIAAIAGPAFDVELVQEVGGWPEKQVLDGMDELLDRRLVNELGSDRRFDYAFSHHLVRSAIYMDIPPSTRKHRHHRVAHVMAELYAQQLEEFAGEIAQHFDQAGEARSAVQYYSKAARRAFTVHADTQALNYLTRALELTDDTRLRSQLMALRSSIPQPQEDWQNNSNRA